MDRSNTDSAHDSARARRVRPGLTSRPGRHNRPGRHAPGLALLLAWALWPVAAHAQLQSQAAPSGGVTEVCVTPPGGYPIGSEVPLSRVVAGRVIGADDREPVVSAIVRGLFAVPMMCGNGWQARATAAEAVTDAEGRFRFVMEPRMGHWALTVLPTAVSGPTSAYRLAGHQLDPEQLELTVSRDARVLGRVVDHTGNPLADVPVIAQAGGLDVATTRTAADGSYVFEQLGGAGVRLRVDLPGWVPAPSEDITYVRDCLAEQVIDLTLTPTWTLDLVVLDDDGSPRALQYVDLRSATTGRSLSSRLTDERGALRIDGLRFDPLSVSIAAAERLPLHRLIEPTSGTTTLRLDDGVAWRGRVLDRRKRPVAGARVSGNGRTTSADAQGRFVLGGLTPGSVLTLVASDPARDSAPVCLEALVPADDVDAEPLRLPRGRSLMARLVHADGSPAAHLAVEAHGTRWLGRHGLQSLEQAADLGRGTTDADGYVRLDGLGDQRVQLRIQLDDERQWVTMARTGKPKLVIKLPKRTPGTLRLSGQVVQSGRGRPVPGFLIKPSQAGRRLPPTFKQWSTPRGEFRIKKLPPSIESLVVTAEGYARQRLGLADGLAGHLKFDRWLEPEVPTRVRFVDQHGEPVSATLTSARDALGPIAGLLDQAAPGDADEPLVLRHVPPGLLELEVALPWNDLATGRPASGQVVLDVRRDEAWSDTVHELVFERP